MAYDLRDLKIQFFSNINDMPVPPTAVKGCNGSYICSMHNDLASAVETGLNELEDIINNLSSGGGSSSGWVVILTNNDSYAAQAGDKIAVMLTSPNSNGEGRYDVILPSQKQLGDAITLINYNPSIPIYLNNYGKFRGSYINQVYLDQVYQEVAIIWLGDDYGWMPTKDGIFTTVYGAS